MCMYIYIHDPYTGCSCFNQPMFEPMILYCSIIYYVLQKKKRQSLSLMFCSFPCELTFNPLEHIQTPHVFPNFSMSINPMGSAIPLCSPYRGFLKYGYPQIIHF